MTKAEMAAKLAAKCDLSQSKAAEVIDCIFSTKAGEGIIAVELDADREVSIAGFGRLDAAARAADPVAAALRKLRRAVCCGVAVCDVSLDFFIA